MYNFISGITTLPLIWLQTHLCPNFYQILIGIVKVHKIHNASISSRSKTGLHVVKVQLNRPYSCFIKQIAVSQSNAVIIRHMNVYNISYNPIYDCCQDQLYNYIKQAYEFNV